MANSADHVRVAILAGIIHDESDPKNRSYLEPIIEFFVQQCVRLGAHPIVVLDRQAQRMMNGTRCKENLIRDQNAVWNRCQELMIPKKPTEKPGA